MALSKSFISVQKEDDEKCLLCQCSISKKSKCTTFKDGGWLTLKEQAAQWSALNLLCEEKHYPLTKVNNKIKDTENAFGKAHVSCRTSFRTKIEWATSKYRVQQEGDGTEPNQGEKIFHNNQGVSRRSVSRYLTEKKLCFVCNSKRICDKNSYRQGGLGRCTEEKAAERLLNRKEEYLKDKDGKHFAAANRLQMIISGECHGIFAADVYYHNSCYLKFAVNPIIQQVKNERIQ